MEDQLKSQLNIIAALQTELLLSIKSGDWSGTDLWNKNLETSVNTFVTLQKENDMALKDQIDILVAAVRDGRTQIAARDQIIADRDKAIADLNQNLATLKQDDDANRAKAATVVEAETAAERAISDLGLTTPATGSSPSTTPASPTPTTEPPVTTPPVTTPANPVVTPPASTTPVPEVPVTTPPVSTAPTTTPTNPVTTSPVATTPAPDAPVATPPVTNPTPNPSGTPPLTQQLSTNP